MNTLFISPLLFGLGWGEIVLIVLVILLLFGGKKIPELMKGMGKGVKAFKDGVNGVEEEAKEIKKDIESEK
jgi:sec-independent protein translocase protein TatA